MKRILLFALLLGGCQLTASQEREADAQGCSTYARPGTPAHDQCVARAGQERQAKAGAALSQIQQNNRDTNEFLTRTITPPTTNCRSVVNGNTIDTACR